MYNKRIYKTTCDGKTFDSLKAFANYYGLNYPKVVSLRRKGMSPEEMLEHCKFTPACKTNNPPKASNKCYPVQFNGVQYNSLYEAATVLEFSPAQLYRLRQVKQWTPEEVVAYAVKMREKNGKQPACAGKKCVVNGVEYESREAAIKAHHVPAITVYTRMKRDGISFEEALIQGRNKKVFIPPARSVFHDLELVPATQTAELPSLNELSRALTYYNCNVAEMQDTDTQALVLLVDNNTYIYYNSDAQGIEIVSEIPFDIDDAAMNAINCSYLATKLFRSVETDKLYLQSFQRVKKAGQDITTLTQMYFMFASVKRVICEQCAEEEGSGN